MLRLSVLDQSPIASGGTAAQAIRNSLELARACDRLGYYRYWLAEHHSTEALAGSAPEVLIGQVAAHTSRMRIGSGGVMLSHYPALKVAECFRMLETLFPGRIDLGVGRAPGSDQRTAQALGGGAMGPAEHFPQQVADLIRFLHDRIEADHPFAGVRAMPETSNAPPLWLLGSTDQSAQLAAYLGGAFSFAHFINPQGGAGVMHYYQQHFRPMPWRERPEGNVAVFALAAEDQAHARYLASSRDLFLLRLRTMNNPGPYPSPEEAASYPYSEHESAIVRANRRRGIVGTPAQVKAGIEQMAADYNVDEVVLVTICHDFAARLRSYELLAEAFGLESSTQTA